MHQVAHAGVSERMDLKLFGREIIFEEFPFPTYVITVTDRYGRTTCNLITALCVASRGKNYIQDSIAIAKKTARCAQYMGALKSFESPYYAPGYCSRNF